jgi:hypothetical protein
VYDILGCGVNGASSNQLYVYFCTVRQNIYLVKNSNGQNIVVFDVTLTRCRSLRFHFSQLNNKQQQKITLVMLIWSGYGYVL